MIYIRSFYEDAIDAAVSRFLKKVGKNPTVTHVCFANKHLFNNKNNVCKIPAEILLWICRNSYVTFQSKSVLFIIYLQSHLNNILRCYKGIHPSSVSHLPMCNHDYLCSSAWNLIYLFSRKSNYPLTEMHNKLIQKPNLFNPFLAYVPILCPLKTPEKEDFPVFSGV